MTSVFLGHQAGEGEQHESKSTAIKPHGDHPEGLWTMIATMGDDHKFRKGTPAPRLRAINRSLPRRRRSILHREKSSANPESRQILWGLERGWSKRGNGMRTDRTQAEAKHC